MGKLVLLKTFYSILLICKDVAVRPMFSVSKIVSKSEVFDQKHTRAMTRREKHLSSKSFKCFFKQANY